MGVPPIPVGRIREGKRSTVCTSFLFRKADGRKEKEGPNAIKMRMSPREDHELLG